MTDIKIFVTYKEKHKVLKSDIITPIQTGRAIADEVFEDMIGDDTGDNISAENPKYNELSAQYWVWKHYEEIGNPDYVGFMHYRRHFLFNNKYNTLLNGEWLKGSNIYKIQQIDDDYIKQNLASNVIKNSNYKKYDCIVLKPYDVTKLNSKDIRTQYIEKVPEQHPENFDLFIKVVREMLPEYEEEISAIETGSVQYLCNMFIMKKDLFFQYSKFLFTVLERVRKLIDATYYTEQEIRFLGYMGEFLLSIFVMHLKKNKYKVLERDGIYVKETNYQEHLKPAFHDNKTAIAVSCSNEYTPYLSVYLLSLAEHTVSNSNYDIIILEKSITENNKQKLKDMLKGYKNISLRFLDVSGYINTKVKIPLSHYREECFFRLFTPELLSDYEKIIFTDCDLVLQDDIMQLNQFDLNGKPLAACIDFIMNAHYGLSWVDWKDYVGKVLGLKDIYSYVNTGVIVVDVKKYLKRQIRQKCLSIMEKQELRTLEQDALNSVLQTDIAKLPTAWNVLTMQKQMYDWQFLKAMSFYVKQQYLKDKLNPKVIHYAAARKPWLFPDEELAEIWLGYARKTPFYEEILARMIDFKVSQRPPAGTDYHTVYMMEHPFRNFVKKISYKIKKQIGSKAHRSKYKEKYNRLKSKLKQVKNLKDQVKRI